MWHPRDPIRSGRSRHGWGRILLGVCVLCPCKTGPVHFHLFLTSGGAAATLAMKQLIYLTRKLMITKDSSTGDNKGRGNPEKIELDWSASEQTNGPVTEGNSYTLSSIGHLVKPDVCLISCRNKVPHWAQTWYEKCSSSEKRLENRL